MEIKAEVFKAIDNIDYKESYFIIYSVNGEDVEYNCISAEYGCVDKMIRMSKSGELFRITDCKASPCRSDMIEPELIETFYLDVE